MRRFVVALAVLGLGCGSSRAAPPRAPSQREWTSARARLSELRVAPARAYVEQIRIAMREPRTGRVVVARGAVAVRPGDAMRMVLLGPGGTTALDAWVTRDRWRLAIPALELTRRGEASPPPREGLPIAFFRWWFLGPYDGRLLDARIDADATTFVLRDGASTVTLLEASRGEARRVLASRRDRQSVERIEWAGQGSSPHVGDRARYVHAASGFAVEVLVDALGDGEPDAAAFLDPDDQGVAL